MDYPLRLTVFWSNGKLACGGHDKKRAKLAFKSGYCQEVMRGETEDETSQQAGDPRQCRLRTASTEPPLRKIDLLEKKLESGTGYDR